MSKDFYPYYEHPDRKETIYIKEVYEKIPYSVALADLMEIAYNQYLRLKGE